jgi:hypothetical protein
MKEDGTMKRAFLAFALILSALAAFAYDFTGSGFTPALGSPDLKAGALLSDESGGQLTFSSDREPEESRVAALRAIVAELRSWKNIQVADIKAVDTAERLAITAMPRSIALGGSELGAALPGGIQLYYDGSTEYDFKLKSSRYVVRVRGIYTSEEDMEAVVLAAYKDPEAFILATDPASLQRRLEELEKRDALREAEKLRSRKALLAALNGARAIDPALVAKLDELKTANPKLSKADAVKALKAAGHTASLAEVSAVYLVDFGEE